MKKLNLMILMAPLVVSGCIPILFAGAGTGAVVASQDRTPGHAVDDTGIRLAINNQFLQKGDVKDLRHKIANIVGDAMLSQKD